MKMLAYAGAAFLVAVVTVSASAQAPSGSTGQCRDGSYTTAASKSGACSGHKGVQTWYATGSAAGAASAAGTAPATSAANPPLAPSGPVTSAPAAKPSTPAAQAAPAAGGGPGMVWVNTASKVYHCQGTAYYGKTKAGKYVTEDAAKAEGDHADHGKPCAK